MTDLPARARAVVIGGGVMGCSTAYHLVKLGWTDVLVLEQGHLSGGTTWHAAGLVGPLRASETGTRLVQYSAELYARLEAETGLATGYRGVGGVIVARTPDRMVQLRRTAANAAAYDLECRMLTPAEAGELWPPMRVDDLLGAIQLPGDGKVNPTDLTQSLARGARQGGAVVREGVRVTGLLTVDAPGGPRVTGVRTEQGDVEADVVVNCAGQWAKAVAELAPGVRPTVPLHSAEHFYVVTERIPGVHPDLPIMRDPDGWTYFKEEVGGLVVGGFEPDAKPWVAPDAIPHPFEFRLLDEDWEHFSPLSRRRSAGSGPRDGRDPEVLQRAGELHPRQPVPARRGARAARLLRRRRLQLGRHRVRRRGGACLAEWVVAGEPTSDLVGRRRPPVRALRRATTAGCARGSPRRSASTTRCRGRCASRRPPAASGCRPCTTGCPPPGRRSAPGWDGSGRTCSPRRRRRRRTAGASRRGCPGRPPSSAPPGRPSRSSTRRRSRSTSSAGPARSPRCSGSAPPTSTCRPTTASTRRCSTRAGRTRRTSR